MKEVENLIEIFKSDVDKLASKLFADIAKISISEEFVEKSSLYGISIENLGLSVRTKKCLKQANIKTLGEIAIQDFDYFLRLKNFGRNSLTELEGMLVKKGLYCGMNLKQYGYIKKGK